MFPSCLGELLFKITAARADFSVHRYTQLLRAIAWTTEKCGITV